MDWINWLFGYKVPQTKKPAFLLEIENGRSLLKSKKTNPVNDRLQSDLRACILRLKPNQDRILMPKVDEIPEFLQVKNKLRKIS
jgi:hypothetical protein